MRRLYPDKASPARLISSRLLCQHPGGRCLFAKFTETEPEHWTPVYQLRVRTITPKVTRPHVVPREPLFSLVSHTGNQITHPENCVVRGRSGPGRRPENLNFFFNFYGCTHSTRKFPGP